MLYRQMHDQFLIFLQLQMHLILFLSIPPSLNIFGFPNKLTIVDSNPILDLPPSRINLILSPNSSFTSSFVTGLIFEDMFALGAARGYFNIFKSLIAIGCEGNLIAKVFFLFVTNFETLLLFFSFKINYIFP